jgi:hypothetical protein
MMMFATSNSRGSKSLLVVFSRLLAGMLAITALGSQVVAQSPPPASFVTSTIFQALGAGANVNDLAVGDINGDGIPDIIAVGGSCIAVLLGNGNGTFQLLSNETCPGGGPLSVALGDFNHDGNLDVAVLIGIDRGVGTGALAIYMGNGTGSLTGPTVYAVGNARSSYDNIVAADLTGNGVLDLVTANDYDGTISVFFGNGDGTFQSQVVYNIGTTSDWVTIADVNHDGKPDLLVACYSSCPSGSDGGFNVLLNNGNGTFATPVFYGGLSKGVNGIAIADVNGDGKLDVATASDGTWSGASIFLGNGDGTFQAPVSYYAPYASAIGIASLNGKPDLVVTDWQDSSISVLLGNGEGTFQPGVAYATDWQPQGLALADFNGDGKLDFAVGNERSEFLTVALGNGDGTFRAGRNNGLTQASQVFNIATADFNGDGNLDIVQAGGVSANNATTVMLGSSHGVLGAPIAGPALCSNPLWVDAGDVNGDGKPDIVATPECNGEVDVLLGKGNGTFNSPVSYSTGDSNSYMNIVKLADLRGAGLLDMVISNSDGNLSVLLNKGNGTFGTASVIEGVTGTGPEYILTGDFNGDGKLDLALPDYTNNAVEILLGNGDGTFQAPISVIGGGAISGPGGLAVADFNHDGKLDLAVTSNNYYGGGGGVAILLGNGDGTFTFSAIYGWLLGSLGQGAPGTQPSDITSADVNGDGNPDLLVSLQQTHIWTTCNCGQDAGNDGMVVLLGKGDGTFVDDSAGPFVVGNESLRVVAGDFNNDGAIDAAVLSNTGTTASYVTLLINNTPPVSVSPLTVNYGTMAVGASKAGTVILTNDQSTSLGISSITLGGTDPGEFSTKSNCGTSLLPGAYCTITVTAKPTAPGAQTATLLINDGAGSQTVQLETDNPVPTLTSFSPSSAIAGSAGFPLTVTGTNFVMTSVVNWAGSPRATAFVSATQITATINTADVAKAGAFKVTVTNPAPGGGTTAAHTFVVDNPVPTLTSISPSSATHGGPAFTLTAMGAGYVPGSTIEWNGRKLATTYVSSTTLTGTVPAAAIKTAGTASVTVVNSAPGGGTSAPATFTIN